MKRNKLTTREGKRANSPYHKYEKKPYHYPFPTGERYAHQRMFKQHEA